MDEPGGEARQTVIVTIRSDKLERIDDVARELEAAGMVIEQVLRSLGQVTGRVPPESVEQLRRVEQVESVSPQRMMGIAPPDSEIQ